MVSLKRVVSNGKIAFEFVLTAPSVLVTKTKVMAGNNLLSMHCLQKKRQLNLMKSRLNLFNYYIKNSAFDTRLLKALCDEQALIIKIFSIRKFVGCPAVKFSRAYVNSERKLSCFYLIRKVACPIISRIRNGQPAWHISATYFLT